MINYQQFTLGNGLSVIVHEDLGSQIAVVNLLYKVGSRNEVPGKTGLAHFFEHLMFGGSKNVPVFDTALERVGGSCNAFTNTDYTNYYISLPASNIETAFWLESDRMFQLKLQKRIIETQRKVVIEEYKQRYLTQPYGDAHHLIRGLAYDVHPYQWPTIGRDIQDIIDYTPADVEVFYKSHYRPDNAILVVAGGVKTEEVKRLAEKWFGDIPSGDFSKSEVSREPAQVKKKTKTVYADVPTDALYKVYHVPGKLEEGYLQADLITDVLGFGRSSILERQLVQKGHVFSSVENYVNGTVDPGLMVFSGKMEKGHTAEHAEAVLDQEVAAFLQNRFPEQFLEKINNQADAGLAYDQIQLIGRAMNLAYFAFLGHPDLYIREFERKKNIPIDSIMDWAKRILREENATVIYYKSNN
jgi:predicted Zn-dependent peptidase